MATLKAKVITWTFPIVSSLLIGIVGYVARDCLARINDIDQRTVELEKNQAAGREQAPRWFVERVDRIESRLTDIEKQLRERK